MKLARIKPNSYHRMTAVKEAGTSTMQSTHTPLRWANSPSLRVNLTCGRCSTSCTTQLLHRCVSTEGKSYSRNRWDSPLKMDEYQDAARAVHVVFSAGLLEYKQTHIDTRVLQWKGGFQAMFSLQSLGANMPVSIVNLEKKGKIKEWKKRGTDSSVPS